MFPREDFHDNDRCLCFSKSAETTFVNFPHDEDQTFSS